MNSLVVESIQQRICFARCALCKAKMDHNLYLSRASFYYTPNWIECRDEFTKLIASCASVLRALNIFIYSFGGWRRRVNSKQLAGHLNGDQICPEARKLLRCQGKEGRKGCGRVKLASLLHCNASICSGHVPVRLLYGLGNKAGV